MKRAIWVVLFLVACGDTGQSSVTYPILAVGASSSSFEVEGWSIELTRADVAFGPLYFCASSGASSELCPEAVQEFAEDVFIDALAPGESRLGEVRGTTGEIRSARYDLGISWSITGNAPTASESAPDEHSFVVEGTATRGADSFSFSAQVDLPPVFAGGHTIAGQRTEVHVTDSDTSLTLSVPIEAWIAEIDFDELAALGVASVEIRDGVPALPDGSADPRQHARDSLAGAITNSHRIQFEWSTGE